VWKYHSGKGLVKKYSAAGREGWESVNRRVPGDFTPPIEAKPETEGGASALLTDKAGDRVHQVKLGEDFELAIVHLDEHRGTFVAQEVRDTLNWGI
jgi:hypothetical protein